MLQTYIWVTCFPSILRYTRNHSTSEFEMMMKIYYERWYTKMMRIYYELLSLVDSDHIRRRCCYKYGCVLIFI